MASVGWRDATTNITNPFKDRSNLKIVNFNFEKQITADFT